MWHFETETHVFLIQMARPGEYELWFDHRFLNRFPDPNAAAKSVLVGKTGEKAWDARPHEQIPTGLDAWMPGIPEGYLPE